MLTAKFSADGNCVLNVETTGRSDITAWYRIWATAVDITALCVTTGRRGSQSRMGKSSNPPKDSETHDTSIGENSNLFVEMYKPAADA